MPNSKVTRSYLPPRERVTLDISLETLCNCQMIRGFSDVCQQLCGVNKQRIVGALKRLQPLSSKSQQSFRPGMFQGFSTALEPLLL